jgi:hypothetical protein
MIMPGTKPIINGESAARRVAAVFTSHRPDDTDCGSFKLACPTDVHSHHVLDQHFLHMIAPQTFERSDVGTVGIFDTCQHHVVVTPGASMPLDRKLRRLGTSIRFRHVSDAPRLEVRSKAFPKQPPPNGV